MKGDSCMYVVLMFVIKNIIVSQAAAPPVCGVPGIPFKGTRLPVKQAYNGGDIVTYTCDSGLLLNTNSIRKCKRNGHWTGHVPFCDENIAKEEYLDNSEDVRDAIDGNENTTYMRHKRILELHFKTFFKIRQIKLTIHNENASNHISVYVNKSQCNRSATFSDFFCKSRKETKRSSVKIRWNQDNLAIQEVAVFKERDEYRCGDPDIPLNGKIHRINDTELKYSCIKRHALEGMRRIKCLQSGVWSDEPPTCKEIPFTTAGKLDQPAPDSSEVDETLNKLEEQDQQPEFNASSINNLARDIDKLFNADDFNINSPRKPLRTIESLLSKISLDGNDEVRTKFGHIEMNIFNLTSQAVPLLCSKKGSELSQVITDDGQCPTDRNDISVKFLTNVTNGKLSVSIFEGDHMFMANSDISVLSPTIIQAKMEDIVLDGNTSPLIEIDFPKPKPPGGTKFKNATCVFLQFTSFGSKWSSEGCWTEVESESRITCQCSHFTHFSVLFYIPLEEPFIVPLSLLTIVSLSISIAVLLLTIFTYVMLPMLRSKVNTVLVHLSMAMILLNSIFLTLIKNVGEPILCPAAAYLLHVLLLVVFLWLLMKTILMYICICRKIAFKSLANVYIKIATAISWVCPLIVATATIIADPSIYDSNEDACWLSREGQIYAFLLPLGCIVGGIFITWVLILCKVVGFMYIEGPQPEIKRELLKQVSLSFILFLLTTLSWLTAVVGQGFESNALGTLFCIFGPAQGIFIFIFHVICDSKARLLWKVIHKHFNDLFCVNPETSITEETCLPESKIS